MAGEVERVRQAPAQERIHSFSVDVAGSRGIPAHGIVNRWYGQRWRDKQVVALEQVPEPYRRPAIAPAGRACTAPPSYPPLTRAARRTGA
jgi:hypothetical protein